MTTTHYDETPAENSNALPPGTYRARAQSWAWDTTKNGDPCIAIMFELIDGKPGYQIDGRLYLDESKPDAKGRTALSRSMEALHAMGLQGDLTADLAGIDQGEVNLVTDINEKGYACVKWINAPRSPRELRTFAPPPAQTLNAFLSRVNGGLRAAEMAQRASGTRAGGQSGQSHQSGGQTHQPVRPAPSAPAQARAATANANASAGNQARPSGGQTRTQAPARNQPPPRMQGQAMGEFQGADDDIPF